MTRSICPLHKAATFAKFNAPGVLNRLPPSGEDVVALTNANLAALHDKVKFTLCGLLALCGAERELSFALGHYPFNMTTAWISAIQERRSLWSYSPNGTPSQHSLTGDSQNHYIGGHPGRSPRGGICKQAALYPSAIIEAAGRQLG
jgi:hypothetical protein